MIPKIKRLRVALGRKKSKEATRTERRDGRFDVQGQFYVQLTKGRLFHKAMAGFGSDLSLNGVRLKTTFRVRKGDKVKMGFRLPPEFPGDKTARVAGKVVYCRRANNERYYYTGIQLQHKDQIQKEVIRQYLWWSEFNADIIKNL